MTSFERESLRLQAVQILLLATIGSALLKEAPEDVGDEAKAMFLSAIQIANQVLERIGELSVMRVHRCRDD